jgi:hypothetical protein
MQSELSSVRYVAVVPYAGELEDELPPRLG